MPIRKTIYNDFQGSSSPRRKRRGVQPGDFQDPLSDYSPPQFDDDLEQDLAELTIADMDAWPPLVVAPTDSIENAIKRMREDDFGCVLVIDSENKLVGIFSERDVLNKIAGHFEATRKLPVSVVMTHNPVVIYDSDPPAKALNMMAIGSFRHLAVLDADDKPIGILGPRRVNAFLQKYFS